MAQVAASGRTDEPQADLLASGYPACPSWAGVPTRSRAVGGQASPPANSSGRDAPDRFLPLSAVRFEPWPGLRPRGAARRACGGLPVWYGHGGGCDGDGRRARVSVGVK